jgi:hypothetical protein
MNGILYWLVVKRRGKEKIYYSKNVSSMCYLGLYSYITKRKALHYGYLSKEKYFFFFRNTR